MILRWKVEIPGGDQWKSCAKWDHPRPGPENKAPELPVSQITARGFYFFYFADLVTDKLTVATEAYWVHS